MGKTKKPGLPELGSHPPEDPGSLPRSFSYRPLTESNPPFSLQNVSSTGQGIPARNTTFLLPLEDSPSPRPGHVFEIGRRPNSRNFAMRLIFPGLYGESGES